MTIRRRDESGRIIALTFWGYVDKGASCWLWTGAIDSDGYGIYGSAGKGRSNRAHRLAWEELVGPIPPKLVVHHRCRSKNCVRPEHLEAVTVRVNTLLDDTPAARNARKTHCPRGHAYQGDNLRLTLDSEGRPRRRCATCINSYRSRRRELNDTIKGPEASRDVPGGSQSLEFGSQK